MRLLDANLLIALLDPRHVHHSSVSAWFVAHHREGWATCPLTENAVVRVVGNPKYPNGPQDTHVVREALFQLCLQPGHQFWPDSISLVERSKFRLLPSAKHLTDFYLLALATDRKATFTSLDQRIDANLVSGGKGTYEILRF